MLPMSSSNQHHYPQIEPGWRAYYDAKRLLRQTEQRLNDARSYTANVHLSNHYETIEHQNLSSTSSIGVNSNYHYTEHSTIVNGNRSIYPDERINSGKYSFRGSEALETIRRKISKQKLAAERRAELFHSQSDAGHLFESSRTQNNYSTSASLQNLHYSPLRQTSKIPSTPTSAATPHFTSSLSSRLSQSQSFPSELDAILRQPTNSRLSTYRENEFERATTVRPSTSIYPRESFSGFTSRAGQQRSASASTGLALKYQDVSTTRFVPSATTARRLESATSTRTNSFQTNFVPAENRRNEIVNGRKSNQEKSLRKSATNEILPKKCRIDDDEDLFANSQIDRMSRTSKHLIKSSSIVNDRTTFKPMATRPKFDDERKRSLDFIQSTRSPHDDSTSFELERTAPMKFNEPIPTHPVIGRNGGSAFTPVQSKHFTEQTHRQLLRILGSSSDHYATSILEQSSLDRSPSPTSSTISSSVSSSVSMCSTCSSSHSITQNIPERLNVPNPTTRPRPEFPGANGNVHRKGQDPASLIIWARNLNEDCDEFRHKLKRVGTEERSASSTTTNRSVRPNSSTQQSQSVNENVRTSASQRSSTRQINENHSNDRKRNCDLAATKIQAAFRSYLVRKSLMKLAEKQKQLHSESNRRTKSNNQQTSQNNPLPVPSDRNKTRKADNYGDSYQALDNGSPSTGSTPTNTEPIDRTSNNSTPTVSDRRRSLSPPSAPRMSADSGRPLPTNNLPLVQDHFSKPTVDSNQDSIPIMESAGRKSQVSSSSSVSSSSRKRKNRTIEQVPSLNNESNLTARQIQFCQKFNGELELQAYEKRLKDIEKKIRQLIKRAFEIFDEKQTQNNAPAASTAKFNADQSSLSEDLSTQNSIKKETDTSSLSTSHRSSSETASSGVRELELRVKEFNEMLKSKKQELERLKQRKTKENLRRQESLLKEQIESYDRKINALIIQTNQQEQTVPIPTDDSKSTSSKLVVDQIPNEIPPLELEQNDEKVGRESEIESLDTPHDAQSLSNVVDESPRKNSFAEENQSEIGSVSLSEPSPTVSAEIVPVKKETPVASQSENDSSPSSKSTEKLSVVRIPKETKVEEEHFPAPPSVDSSHNDFNEDTSHDISERNSQTDQHERNLNFLNSLPADIAGSLNDSNKQSEPTSGIKDSSDDASSDDLSGEEKLRNSTSQEKDSEEEFKYINLKPLSDDNIGAREPEDDAHIDSEKLKSVFDDEDDLQSSLEESLKPIEKHEDNAVKTNDNKTMPEKSDVQVEETEKSDDNKITPEDDNVQDEKSGKGNDNIEVENESDTPEDKESDISDPPARIKPQLPNSREEVSSLCDEAVRILLEQNSDWSNPTRLNRTVPNEFFNVVPLAADEIVAQNQKSYLRMIFDLCAEILIEVNTPSIQPAKFGQWQRAKIVPKRFTRSPTIRSNDDVRKFVLTKVLEMLNFMPKNVTYSKWRMPMIRRRDTDRFENVLDEELRRNEVNWINYDDDCNRVKFDLAEQLFEQLIDETLTECLVVVKKRVLLSSETS